MKPILNVVQTQKTNMNDPENIEDLYEDYFPKVYNYVRYRVLDPILTDDLTSTVFYKAFDHLSNYDPARAGFATWLFAIARNTINDHQRTVRRRRLLSLEWLRDRAGDALDPEQMLLGSEERERLLGAIATLPKRERDILGLKYAAGETNRAIAGLLGLSESNVGIIVHRALEKLRGRMLAEEKKNER